jgi:receptor protein-tyrosine kinase
MARQWKPSMVERAAERLEEPGSAHDTSRQPSADPGTGSRRRPIAAAARMRVDPHRLAKAGIYSPTMAANRTTEEFRLIKQGVLQRVAKASETGMGSANVIMVTSTRQGEGKSFVSANLAVSIAAEEGRPVVLIDADASRSSIARIFGLPRGPGLLDLLASGDLGVADVLVATNLGGLHIIQVGRPHPLGSELLSGERMGRFLEEIGRECRDGIVIFDASPVLATAEPGALARHVGQVVYVVEAEETGRLAVAEALNLISICPNIGFVLNKLRFRFGAVRFGNYYKYYYKRASRSNNRR